MTAKIYHNGNYVTSIECLSFDLLSERTILYKDEHKAQFRASIPASWMIEFPEPGVDYDKMAKDLKEKQS